MPDYQLVPIDHDPFRFSFTPVEHDPFADVMPPQRSSATQQWQSAIEEQRQRDIRKPSMGEQVLDVVGNTPNALKVMGRYTPLGSLAARMGETYEGGIDWSDPEQVKQASGGTLLDMAGLAGGTAGAAERGTVGALGGKPGMMVAASKAVPMAREGTETAAKYAAPAGLQGEMRNLALTGKHGYRESSETAGELFAKQMEWLRGKIGGPFPETLEEVAPRGKIDVMPSGIKYIPVDHDPFKK